MKRNHFVFEPEYGVTLIKPHGDSTYTIFFKRNGTERSKTFMMVNAGKDFQSFELKAKSHMLSVAAPV